MHHLPNGQKMYSAYAQSYISYYLLTHDFIYSKLHLSHAPNIRYIRYERRQSFSPPVMAAAFYDLGVLTFVKSVRFLSVSKRTLNYSIVS